MSDYKAEARLILQEIQNEISSLSPSPYYLNAYRDAEYNYWEHIPGWMLEHCQNNKTINVLDVGAAYGTLLTYAHKISNCNCYAVDFVKYISDDLINKYNIKYQINNIETEDFPWDVKFDVILFTEVLEHLNYNILPTLQKIKNLLSENGKLFLSTPDAFFWGRCKEYKSWKDIPDISKKIEIKDCHIYQFSESELIEIFKIVGLKIEKIMWSDGFNGLKHFNMLLSKV